MKFSAVILLSALAAVQAFEVSDEKKKIMLNIWKVCKEKSQISTDLQQKAHTLILEDDETVKDYIHCIMKTLEIVSDKNEFLQKDEFLKRYSDVFGAETINKVVDECYEKKENPKKTAFSLAKCAFKFRPLDNLPAPNE